MTHVSVNPRFAVLLVLAGIVLIPLAFAQNREAPAKSPDIGTLKTSPMPLQWQVDQLRAQVHALQQHVQALQNQGSPVGHLHQRVSALEGVVQVLPTGVRIQSAGRIELLAQGDLDLQSGQVLGLAASKVNVGSALVEASGVVQSDTVITNSVVASSYTPGAGNVW